MQSTLQRRLCDFHINIEASKSKLDVGVMTVQSFNKVGWEKEKEIRERDKNRIDR